MRRGGRCRRGCWEYRYEVEVDLPAESWEGRSPAAALGDAAVSFGGSSELLREGEQGREGARSRRQEAMCRPYRCARARLRALAGKWLSRSPSESP